jgi:hypothetical protein
MNSGLVNVTVEAAQADIERRGKLYRINARTLRLTAASSREPPA